MWAIFAYLALSDRPPTRQQLAELLFPDADDPAAALRWNLSELRRLLGDPGTVGSGSDVRLRLPEGSSIDVHVLMGGTSPGWTTDRVAASLARVVKADRLVNATSVDGVYSEDPKDHPFAQRFEKLTYAKLISLTGEGHTRAGPKIVFDPVAARVAAKAGIPLLILDGRDLGALRAAISGDAFHGTTVSG